MSITASKKIHVGVIGGAGYTAGELLRLLVFHPMVEIDFVYSTSQAGKPLYSVHQDLLPWTSQNFSSTPNPDVDVVFLCLGHGNSSQFLSAHSFSKKTRIIDLSNDFRLSENASFDDYQFIYGLPELQLQRIQEAHAIANPGCFATAIQLALLPLAQAQKLNQEVHIHALTGSTGAGVKPSATTHFSWRNNNISYYKAFRHQHLAEIYQSIQNLQTEPSSLNFLPIRGNFTRGIFVTAYLNFEDSLEEAEGLYRAFYGDHPFTVLSNIPLHLKQVVNTNFCFLHLAKEEGKLLITSIIDNLLKGASGQAIQNMNVMFGWDQTTGLGQKSSYF